MAAMIGVFLGGGKRKAVQWLQNPPDESGSSLWTVLVSLYHCSAGVGRSGTFIALDWLLQQLKHEKVVDVFHTIYSLRMSRHVMIQTPVRTWELPWHLQLFWHWIILGYKITSAFPSTCPTMLAPCRCSAQRFESWSFPQYHGKLLKKQSSH